MTYQEILEEFDRRRARETHIIMLPDGSAVGAPRAENDIQDLQWAIQSILEKLRDSEQT